MKTALLSLLPNQLADWLEVRQEKPYRAKQIFEWVYQKKVLSFEEMTNISKGLKQTLSEAFLLPSIKPVSTQESLDKETTKLLFELQDGMRVEAVLIRSDDRRTVCVSSQVGCPARCAFCASGQQGWKRNLSSAEIVEQVLTIDALLHKENERVSHIVYMGMGEPLKNYDAVIESIKLLTHSDLLNLSPRRITVSTVGVVEEIYHLAKEGIKVNLALSLHAPNQKIRQKIIHYARQYALEEILNAVDFYSEATKRDITFEYTLLEGINDQPEHALELASLLKGKQCTVNLIPYNPIPNLRLKKPSPTSIRAFREVLSNKKIVHTCRYTKGDDIAAACGQLALQTIP